MNFDFLSDILSQLRQTYKSRGWPPLFLTVCVLGAGILEQWIIAFIGLGGFLYWQFFDRER